MGNCIRERGREREREERRRGGEEGGGGGGGGVDSDTQEMTAQAQNRIARNGG
jgi:hypothetical protein